MRPVQRPRCVAITTDAAVFVAGRTAVRTY
ncbi:MAG: hypothetical protein QOG89_2385, partial [Thermomicrobiales bacterium]|nr:hypothetical protein [Thermomicrobiales bacterium]